MVASGTRVPQRDWRAEPSPLCLFQPKASISSRAEWTRDRLRHARSPAQRRLSAAGARRLAYPYQPAWDSYCLTSAGRLGRRRANQGSGTTRGACQRAISARQCPGNGPLRQNRADGRIAQEMHSLVGRIRSKEGGASFPVVSDCPDHSLSDMPAMGQNQKTSRRAYVFRFSPQSRHRRLPGAKQKDYLAVILPDAWGEPCLFLSLAKEKDHGRSRKYHSYCEHKPALEQGQADRGEAAAASQTCLVDSDEAPDRGAGSRPCDVQSGDRQQASWLRCRRDQG